MINRVKITIGLLASLFLAGCATQQTLHHHESQQQQMAAAPSSSHSVTGAVGLSPVPDSVVISVVGYGAPGGVAENSAQRRLMALRASEADAHRKLAEQVSGLRIFGDTRVDNYITQNDRIRQNFSAFIQGATITHQEYQEDGTAVTHMSMNVSRSELRKRLQLEQYYHTHGYHLVPGTAYPN